MPVVMDVELPTGTFLFGEVFGRLPRLRVDIERVVPMRSEIIPFVWVRGADRHDFESVTTEFVPVDALECVFEDDEVLFYRLFWTTEAAQFFEAVHVPGLVITRASGTADGWSLGLQFDDRETLMQFRRQCAENDVHFDVKRMTDVTDASEVAGGGANWHGLTDPQRAALARALEAGYYREPRETSIEELAAEFGISARAMSGRLRRGTERLIETTLSREVYK